MHLNQECKEYVAQKLCSSITSRNDDKLYQLNIMFLRTEH